MRALSVVLKVSAGLVVGLVLAELAFRARSEGAFPHLNIYEPDSALGVHLTPGAEMRLSFSGNPVTRVSTNSQGFRGPDWPAASDRDVLVVGDSQVFGLGVEQEETFAAQLQAAMGEGGHVLNAGVPTYGPLEYTALVERLVAERKPARVVYVLNMANDLFELERPNRERHVVWDGWAVRSETAPGATIELPGRRWLMSQSHAVYALRSWLRGLDADDAQFASEGGFQDIVDRAKATDAMPAAPEQLGGTRGRLAEDLANTDWELSQAFTQMVLRDKRYQVAVRGFGLQGDPRDIVQPYATESARPVRTTAAHLLLAALSLDKNARTLETLAADTKNTSLLEHVVKRRQLREDLAKSAQPDAAPVRPGKLEDVLSRTQRACDAVFAELMVVVLPLDVQVSAEEWKKYGQPPLDMSATAALNQDVAERAKRLGVRVLDATAALRAAEPGAFLKGDLHMTPRGHAALARAISAAWQEPVSPPAALPAGRSPLPASDEWQAVEPMVVSESPAQCHVKRVREWWRVLCGNQKEAPYDEVFSIGLVRGGRGEAIADLGYRGSVERVYVTEAFGFVEPQLIAPVLEGDVLEVRFGWWNHVNYQNVPRLDRTLRVSWDAGAAPRVEWGPTLPPTAAEGIQPTALHATINKTALPIYHPCSARLWAPFVKAQEAHDYEAASALYEELERTRLDRACQLGQPQQCDPGEVTFGVLGRCVPACSRDKPCEHGTCTADRGRFGCIEP
jgi:hypothetical protein